MIIVAGIGPGKKSLIFQESMEAIRSADRVIGSVRQLALFPEISQENKMILPKKLVNLKKYLIENKEKKCVVLASGDPMLFGIGNWLSKEFTSDELQIISGISSIQYLFAKAHLSMNDCYVTSSHGKKPDYTLLFSLPKVAMVTDQKIGPYELAKEAKMQKKDCFFLIGENLSYENERIQWYARDEVLDREYDMNVVVIVDER